MHVLLRRRLTMTTSTQYIDTKTESASTYEHIHAPGTSIRDSYRFLTVKYPYSTFVKENLKPQKKEIETSEQLELSRLCNF
jgi:hypothetical protein